MIATPPVDRLAVKTYVMPFDNTLILGQISGAKLKTKFLGGSYYAAQAETMPEIQDDATYYIVTDSYTAYDAKNGITVVDHYDNYYARDCIADFVKTGAWNS